MSPFCLPPSGEGVGSADGWGGEKDAMVDVNCSMDDGRSTPTRRLAPLPSPKGEGKRCQAFSAAFWAANAHSNHGVSA